MGRQGALGLTGRARSEQDGRVVFRSDLGQDDGGVLVAQYFAKRPLDRKFDVDCQQPAIAAARLDPRARAASAMISAGR
jgi:hypothetical protein